jgi:hypothetical protein
VSPSRRYDDLDDLSVFFCTSKIHGGQDRTFLFRGGLVNYKAHFSLS